MSSIRSLTAPADWAGWGGLVPFAIAAVGVLYCPDIAGRSLAQSLGLAWGAVILAFLGAVHWGLALAHPGALKIERVVGSVLPAVVGAAALLIEGQRGLGLLVVGFGAYWLYEHHRCADLLPEDYLALRRKLTIGVCSLLALTLLASEQAGLR